MQILTESPPYAINCWKTFFEAIPKLGLTKIKSLDPGSVWANSRSRSAFFHALGAMTNDSIITFPNVSTLSISTGAEDLSGLSAALRAGAFPSIREVAFKGKL